MNAREAFLWSCFLFQFMPHLCFSEQQLKVGFYSLTCPKAESIVTSVVKELTFTKPFLPPVLLRLHFHDCFVEGCDGSILIDRPDQNDEKHADANVGVIGFEEIQAVKHELEAECSGIVSCADIVALAARDAVVLAGGTFYEVETGRKDGRVSEKSLSKDMPEVNDSIDTLKSKFRNKGLSEKELVLLSGGAHTIGSVACSFMPRRLYNFTGRDDSDPEINPKQLTWLKRYCPQNGTNPSHRLPLDVVTPDKFDDQIFWNIKTGLAVIASDARLYDDKLTKQVVDSYVDDSTRPHSASSFGQDFAMSMVKMGRIEVKMGTDGEIRKVCNSTN